MRHIFWVVVALWTTGFLHAEEYAARYRERLRILDKAAPESVCSAREALREWMPLAEAGDRAALFHEFRGFYLAAIEDTNGPLSDAVKPIQREMLGWMSAGRSVQDIVAGIYAKPDMRRAIGPWLRCGFAFDQGVGFFFPALDSGTLLEFVPLLPPDLADFVRFSLAEAAQRVGGDGALGLSWEELRARLMRWEEFARRYPQLPETHNVVELEIPHLAELYFFGVDNTPTFDFGTGRIYPELVASWSRLAASDRESSYKGLAAALVLRIKETGGKLSAGDRVLFEAAGYEREFDQWWRGVQFRLNERR